MRLVRITWWAWAVCGVVLFLFGTNLWLLWAVWLVSLGILLGKALSRQPCKPEMVGLSIALFVCGTLVIRALPIHWLNWEGTSRIVISKLGEDWKIEIADPEEIKIFQAYGRRGHYETIQKSGYGYHLYVGDGNSLTSYYIHGDCIGEMPGGSAQSVFVPAKEGFMAFFEGVIKKHGHEVK